MTWIVAADSGLAEGIYHSAFDRKWLRLHAAGERPGLLRFYRSLGCASVGRHQAIDRELRLDYCHARSIAVVRRATGGGAIYVDPGQIGFSLVLPGAAAPSDAAGWLEQGALGVAAALRGLGIEARWKAPNDVEVGGRKIAGVFVGGEGASILIQGTLLLDADIRTALEALCVPTEKLSADGLGAARQRMVTLRECLGGLPSWPELRAALECGIAGALGLGIAAAAPQPGFLDAADLAAERRLALRIDWSARHGPWLEALWRTESCTLRARCGESAVQFAADAQALPGDALERLERALAGSPPARAAEEAEHFFAHNPVRFAGCGAADFRRLLQQLADRQHAARAMGLDAAGANALMVFAPEGATLTGILERATVMLLPYCAKPAFCPWRHEDECTECGLCEVGDAYAAARSRGLRVATVVDYEHLVRTLAQMKARGEPAYVGACCSNFFLKRHRAFREAGLPAVLMDISGANCYELRQEELAYAGRFEAQAQLDGELLQQVMRFVPEVWRRAPAGELSCRHDSPKDPDEGAQRISGRGSQE